MVRKQMSVISNQKIRRRRAGRILTAALAVLMTDYCLLPSGTAETTAPPVKLPPVTADTRAPQQTDDSTIPYPNGAQWQFQSEVWKLIDNTAQYAMWSRIETKALPLDVIGLYVSAAAVNAGGSGYATNDLITLAGGVVLKVTNQSGGVIQSGGVSVQTPNMHACAPASLSGIAQQATSGSGNGATFNLTLLYPTAYGTRLLGRCYNGYALTAVRSDTGESRQIGFLADGNLDTANLDGFAQGDLPMALAYTQTDTGLVVPRLSVLNDQGAQNGNAGNNATQATAANRPTIFPGRRLGNARSVMFDAENSGATPWNPTTTSMTLPSGVALTGNNSTVIALSGHKDQYQFSNAPVLVGSTAAAGYAVGIAFHDFSVGSEECPNGSTNSNAGADKVSNYIPTDTPQIEICNNGASGVTYTNNTQTQSFTGGNSTGSASTATGGALGVPGNGHSGTGMIDLAAVILVPWSLDANTQAAVQASLNGLFGLSPQMNAMIIAGCDSHVSGWGATYQQSWPREMVERLGRRDLQLINVAGPGESVNACGNSNWWIPLTAFQGTNVQRWFILQGGYNDLNGGATVAQTEGYYATAAANAHSAGAKVACTTDPIRNASAGLNANAQLLNAYLRANTGGFCDLVIDPAADPVFNNAAGPWNAPWFEQQDSGIHLSSQGNALWAALAAKAFAGVLQ